MTELDEAAKEAGITVVNEVGLDPGIDHLLAMECFDEIHSHGGKVCENRKKTARKFRTFSLRVFCCKKGGKFHFILWRTTST